MLYFCLPFHDFGTINPDTSKPEAVEFYNLTKGGVDCMDKMCHSYTTKSWTMRYLCLRWYGMLDIMDTHYSYILNSLARNNVALANFLKTVSYSLIEPQLKRRAVNQRISRNLRLEIGLIIWNEQQTDILATDEPPRKRMSVTCVPEKMIVKTNNYCGKCNRPNNISDADTEENWNCDSKFILYIYFIYFTTVILIKCLTSKLHFF